MTPTIISTVTVAFLASFVEVVEAFTIVLAVGLTGALAALVVVVAIGALVHRPLSRVPENTLKFVVGLMLTSFGIFWIGEGLGADWPGSDLSLTGIFVVLVVASLAITAFNRNGIVRTEEGAV